MTVHKKFIKTSFFQTSYLRKREQEKRPLTQRFVNVDAELTFPLSSGESKCENTLSIFNLKIFSVRVVTWLSKSIYRREKGERVFREIIHIISFICMKYPDVKQGDINRYLKTLRENQGMPIFGDFLATAAIPREK